MGRVTVLGGGIFGVAGARELQRRGHRVTLCDPGPIPHPQASSTDISKVVRLDYGSDVFYTELMERALARWRADPLLSRHYHETGVAILSGEPLAPSSFEGDSLRVLVERGHRPVRLDAEAIAARFPVWRPGRFVEGYYNPEGGWAESGAVVQTLARAAAEEGVAIVEAERTVDEAARAADLVVVAAGAWTPLLLPELSPVMRAVGQPLLCFSPPDPSLFSPPRLPVWTADVARTGWYGFCANPTADGVLKVANHGPGTPIDPRGPRPLPDGTEARFRAFLADALPTLADAPLSQSRLCLYCDSRDGDLWIARHPDRAGVVVAAGGSGHGFKLAPLLGELIADVAEERHEVERFAWRAPDAERFEDARFRG